MTDEPDAAPLPRRERRMSARTRALLIGGGAAVLVLAIVAGLVVANRLDAQAAADERRTAETEAADAARAFDAATASAEEAHATLTELVASADAALAVTGAGIDETARATLQSARDAADAAARDDAEPSGVADVPKTSELDASDDRSFAVAVRELTELVDQNAASENARADRLTAAADELAAAVDDYLTSTVAAGGALLGERGDAADDAKATLQAQLDALPSTEPSALADALAAYRAAVDAVVASSDAARAPASPGGTGIRVPDPSSLTAVVNKRRGLAADYVPPGLTTPANIPGATQVRQELIEPLERMRADMAAAGITLRMSSAYRSYARQQTIYNGFVAREGVAGADTHSARPGNSEHQTGLAVDLDDGTGCNLSACFGNAPGGRWLAENSWKYGFILRYGDGWQPIVGYSYEPWHFRYVGVEVATDMHNRGIRTLEEYFGLPAAPDYG